MEVVLLKPVDDTCFCFYLWMLPFCSCLWMLPVLHQPVDVTSFIHTCEYLTVFIKLDYICVASFVPFVNCDNNIVTTQTTDMILQETRDLYCCDILSFFF